MISVQKNYKDVPGRLTTANCQERRISCNQNPMTHKHDAYYYRDGVLAELQLLYRHKCGYCETSVDAGSVLRVDHFRPKKKVSGLSGHNGYYWLTYEWSNLVLACEKCNGKKSDQFPIGNENARIFAPNFDPDGDCHTEYRVATSQHYLDEEALLLNPELDVVESHLFFLPSGVVRAVSARGTRTITVLDLNRDALVLARKKQVDLIRDEIDGCIDDYIVSQNETHITLSLNRTFRKLFDLQNPVNQYSRLGWFMFNKFDLFFCRNFGVKQRTLVNKAFSRFLRDMAQQII